MSHTKDLGGKIFLPKKIRVNVSWTISVTWGLYALVKVRNQDIKCTRHVIFLLCFCFCAECGERVSKSIWLWSGSNVFLYWGF